MPKSIAAISTTQLRNRHNLRLAEVVGGALLSVLGWVLFFHLSALCGGVNFYGGNSCWSTGSGDYILLGFGAVVCIGVGGPLLLHGLLLYLILNVLKWRDEGPLTHATEAMPLSGAPMMMSVVANVDAGQVMPVNDGKGGLFQVTVPAGVVVGQAFQMQMPSAPAVGVAVGVPQAPPV